MVAYTTRMPAGIAGVVTRAWEATIETGFPTATTANVPTAYGVALALDASGNYRAIQASDTLANFAGFLARPFPTSDFVSDAFNAGGPRQTGTLDVLKRGYMSVLLGGSTAAAKGGLVYIWIAASTGLHVQGQVEAAATSGDTIVLDAKSYFMGPADANGYTEIALNI